MNSKKNFSSFSTGWLMDSLLQKSHLDKQSPKKSLNSQNLRLKKSVQFSLKNPEPVLQRRSSSFLKSMALANFPKLILLTTRLLSMMRRD